jgi:signal peptidase
MKRLRLALWLTVPLIVAAMFVLAISGALPYKLYVVHTGSMWPAIPSRSAVLVQEHQYTVGQPIAFVVDGAVITHRLVAISAEGIITTKGDANATPDPWHVRTSAIIGGVVASPPELGYWIIYLRNPVGLISILVAILLVWQVWSFADRTTRDARHRSSTARDSTRSIESGGIEEVRPALGTP